MAKKKQRRNAKRGRSEARAMLEGRGAGQLGLSQALNPYPEGTKEHRDWRAGYLKAQVLRLGALYAQVRTARLLFTLACRDLPQITARQIRAMVDAPHGRRNSRRKP